MYLLKTTLPEHIDSLDAAKNYLIALHSNGESYHPDDPAGDCFPEINELDSHHMNHLMKQVFVHFETAGLDVYEFINGLHGHIMED